MGFARQLKTGLTDTFMIGGKTYLEGPSGCRPVVLVAACAVSGIRRMADRPACSVVERILRWRLTADMAVEKDLVVGARC